MTQSLKSALVFGKNGQVGRALQNLTLKHGYNWTFAGREDIDLSDPASLQAFIEKHKPEGLINAAAYTAVDKAESEPDIAFAVNAKAPAIMAAYCKARDIPFVHISTDYVFDGTKETPYVESDPVAPLSVYGQSKADGEDAILACGGKSIILRTSWVYAPEGKNFVNTMIRLGQEKDTLRIVSDQIGAPTAAFDIAEALTKIWPELCKAQENDPAKTGLFHMSAQGGTSWYGFAEDIFKQLSEKGIKTPERIEPIPTSAYPTPAKRPLNSRLDCEKLQRSYGVTLPEWPNSLARCLNEILKDNTPRQQGVKG